MTEHDSTENDTDATAADPTEATSANAVTGSHDGGSMTIGWSINTSGDDSDISTQLDKIVARKVRQLLSIIGRQGIKDYAKPVVVSMNLPLHGDQLQLNFTISAPTPKNLGYGMDDVRHLLEHDLLGIHMEVNGIGCKSSINQMFDGHEVPEEVREDLMRLFGSLIDDRHSGFSRFGSDSIFVDVTEERMPFRPYSFFEERPRRPHSIMDIMWDLLGRR